eukprot:11762229-Alexandrium_andersonii.AAC.1
MSASLVGSEMCIRDSLRTCHSICHDTCMGRPCSRDRRRASSRRSAKSSTTSAKARIISSWSAVGRIRGTGEVGRAPRDCARVSLAPPVTRPGLDQPP